MTHDHDKQKLPQREVKRKAILSAAKELFLDVGFGAASMDAITQKAGVSKPTVYNHFGNKENLFGAIIKDRCHNLLSSLEESEVPSNDLELTLRKTAEHFLGLIMSEPVLALYRVVIAEASRFPELALVFYENGPGQTTENFARYLSEQSEQGKLDISNPTKAAEQFFSLLSGHVHMRALLGIASHGDAPDIENHITMAIETFLRANRPRS